MVDSHPITYPNSEQEVVLAFSDEFAQMLGDEILSSARPPGVYRIPSPPPLSKQDDEIARLRRKVRELERKLELQQCAAQDWFST